MPRFTLQPTCNYPLFSAGCTLDRASWTFRATFANPGPAGFPHTFDIANIDSRLVGFAVADYFAGGFIEMGAGPTYEVLPIVRSTAMVDQALTLTLTLARDPRFYPLAGQAVALIPGCDARAETCKTKFFNYLNFGGHPFIPKANASVTPPNASQNTGKK